MGIETGFTPLLADDRGPIRMTPPTDYSSARLRTLHNSPLKYAPDQIFSTPVAPNGELPEGERIPGFSILGDEILEEA